MKKSFGIWMAVLCLWIGGGQYDRTAVEIGLKVGHGLVGVGCGKPLAGFCRCSHAWKRILWRNS